MQAFCLCVSVLFSHLHTRNSFYLLAYTHVIRPPVTVFFVCISFVPICPSVSILLAHELPRYLTISIHVTRLPVFMLLAYPYICRYLPIRRHKEPACEKPRNTSWFGCGTLPGRVGRRVAVREAASRAGAGQGGGTPVGLGSLPLTPSYLRPRGWRCRRWCAPPAGAWQTPGRSAPAPAPAP